MCLLIAFIRIHTYTDTLTYKYILPANQAAPLAARKNGFIWKYVYIFLYSLDNVYV